MMGVTRRVYRRWCGPAAPPVDAHRRRQLADLVDRYGVTDHRPATTTADADVSTTPAVIGEVLL